MGSRLTDFNKNLYWEDPEEGLYNVDVGLKSDPKSPGLNLAAFADLNNDKYTDIITLNDDRTRFTVHIFDSFINQFVTNQTVTPEGCGKITNIFVGRAIDRQRVFITCNPRG